MAGWWGNAYAVVIVSKMVQLQALIASLSSDNSQQSLHYRPCVFIYYKVKASLTLTKLLKDSSQAKCSQPSSES